MTYSLYRVEDPTDLPTAGIHLGQFTSFEDALAARDDDTTNLFAATGPGQILVAHHQIVGPGSLGDATAHPISTGMPRSDPATDLEVSEARRWLDTIHHDV